MIEPKKVDVADLVEKTTGSPLPFYGVADNCFKLGKLIYEVVEDPDDGWRSSMDYVHVVEADGRPFFAKAIAKVRVVSSDAEETWLLKDEGGHVWLEFGTTDAGDWYPCFTFSYSPKEAS